MSQSLCHLEPGDYPPERSDGSRLLAGQFLHRAQVDIGEDDRGLRGPSPHDLLHLSDPRALVCAMPMPSWVQASLFRAPFVVVRRGRHVGDCLPVGVRGVSRHERFAAFVPIDGIAHRVAPEDLAAQRAWRTAARRRIIPALEQLERVAEILDGSPYRWGVGGGVGFELATAAPVATVRSDLDLILRVPHRLSRWQARDLLAALPATSVRLDIVMETPVGGVLLRDYAGGAEKVLLRTIAGPRLVEDPWARLPIIPLGEVI